MLPWPEHQADLEDLAGRGLPRLLLVSPHSAPPVCTDCLEDWVRLPIDEFDRRARLHTLAERHHNRTPPTVDEYGVLRQDDTLVFLSPYEQRLAGILIERFGEVLPSELIEQELADDHNLSRVALRVHASRLRKLIAPLGLTITCIKQVGYVMHRDTASR
ncbi:MAG: helix-turn-helix domain-containing protein [Acidimicrobiia bacterium]